MAYIHNLTLTDSNKASDLLGKEIDNQSYELDVQFWSDSLGYVLASLRGTDYDDEFDSIMDEIEFDHSESQDGEEYVTIIGPTVINEFAKGIISNLSKLAEMWVELEFYYLDKETVEKMLETLHKWCSESIESSKCLAIHSYE